MSTATARLRERADSYARDARTFRDSVKLGQPIGGSADDCQRWAASYQVIADELRKAAAEITEGE